MIYEFNASKFFSCVEFASVIQFLVNNQTTNDQSPIMIRNDENTTKCDAFSIELTTIVSESEWALVFLPQIFKTAPKQIAHNKKYTGSTKVTAKISCCSLNVWVSNRIDVNKEFHTQNFSSFHIHCVFCHFYGLSAYK